MSTPSSMANWQTTNTSLSSSSSSASTSATMTVTLRILSKDYRVGTSYGSHRGPREFLQDAVKVSYSYCSRSQEGNNVKNPSIQGISISAGTGSDSDKAGKGRVPIKIPVQHHEFREVSHLLHSIISILHALYLFTCCQPCSFRFTGTCGALYTDALFISYYCTVFDSCLALF
jgi:hypothetical protein